MDILGHFITIIIGLGYVNTGLSSILNLDPEQ